METLDKRTSQLVKNLAHMMFTRSLPQVLLLSPEERFLAAQGAPISLPSQGTFIDIRLQNIQKKIDLEISHTHKELSMEKGEFLEEYILSTSLIIHRFSEGSWLNKNHSYSNETKINVLNFFKAFVHEISMASDHMQDVLKNLKQIINMYALNGNIDITMPPIGYYIGEEERKKFDDLYKDGLIRVQTIQEYNKIIEEIDQ